MRRLNLLALGAALIAALGVSSVINAEIKPLPPGIQAPVVVPPDWQSGTSRLGTGITWGAIRQFTMTSPDNPAECRLACERSQLCASWTVTRDPHRPVRAPRVDFCVLQAIVLPARSDACCTSGLRRSPLPSVAEVVTGDREMFLANSSYSRSSIDTVYLRHFATPWECRAACIEHGSSCVYWTFQPAGSARFAHCFVSNWVYPPLRADGWTAGGPVPR